MAEEKKEKWLTYLSATTVIIAVCATLSTFKGGGYSTKALLHQSKASDQWAHFQAKGIKSYIYEVEVENINTQLLEKNNEEVIASLTKRKDKYNQKIEQYGKEKEEIKKEAEKLEGIRDDSKKHSEVFGMAVLFLQVSILLSSIAALIKKKEIWFVSMALGLIGIVYFKFIKLYKKSFQKATAVLKSNEQKPNP